jgi:hypothetical protein
MKLTTSGLLNDSNIILVNTFGNALTATSATYAASAGTCTGNAATATSATYAGSAGTCTGNAATATSATYAGTCTGNAATATSATYAGSAGTCTGNAATVTSATYAATAGSLTNTYVYRYISSLNNGPDNGTLNENIYSFDTGVYILFAYIKFNISIGSGSTLLLSKMTQSGSVLEFYYDTGFNGKNSIHATTIFQVKNTNNLPSYYTIYTEPISFSPTATNYSFLFYKIQ